MNNRLSLLLVASALAGCRPASPPSSVAPAVGGGARDTTCELAPGPVQSAGTLSVALTGAVDPAHAPVPATEAERLVFPQLYETLIRVDCMGRVVPALSETWHADGDGRQWTFTLRGDAHFWDGAPVTAVDVIASWRRSDSLAMRWNPVAPNEREVQVNVPDPSDIKRLAAASLAVTKPSPDRGWPIGTARYWISGRTATAAPVIQPLAGGAGPVAPIVAFRDISGTDPRDALDQGVGLLLTDDPSVVSYAAARPDAGFAALPLRGDRRYVLLVPAGEAPAVDRSDLVAAVHAEARADNEGWPSCTGGGAGSDATAARPILPTRRLVYDRSDRIARELAERLVGRGVLGARVPAVALAPADFASAIRDGTAWAYVAAVPPTGPCANASSESGIATLIAVHRYAVVRRGFARLQLDADGTVRIVP